MRSLRQIARALGCSESQVRIVEPVRRGGWPSRWRKGARGKRRKQPRPKGRSFVVEKNMPTTTFPTSTPCLTDKKAPWAEPKVSLGFESLRTFHTFADFTRTTTWVRNALSVKERRIKAQLGSRQTSIRSHYTTDQPQRRAVPPRPEGRGFPAENPMSTVPPLSLTLEEAIAKARADALEEAARICDDVASHVPASHEKIKSQAATYRTGACQCAWAIRSKASRT